jgi:hypothetical protein
MIIINKKMKLMKLSRANFSMKYKIDDVKRTFIPPEKLFKSVEKFTETDPKY